MTLTELHQKSTPDQKRIIEAFKEFALKNYISIDHQDDWFEWLVCFTDGVDFGIRISGEKWTATLME